MTIPTASRITPRAALSRRRLHVHHQIPERVPELDHRNRGDRVQHELLRRARLHPRRPSDHLWADVDLDRKVGGDGERRVPNAGEPDRERARSVAIDPRLLHFFDLETGVVVPTVDVPVAAGVVG